MNIILILAALGLLAAAGLRTYHIRRYNRRRRRPGQGRRRRKKLDVLTIALYVLAAAALLLGLVLGGEAPGSADSQVPETPTETQSPYGWQEENGRRYYLNEDGTRATGWLELDGKRYYLAPDGYTLSGWAEVEGRRLCFDADGAMHTGWLTQGGVTYYILEDGSLAKGQVEIDGVNCFFTSTGAQILVVNPWNPVPEGYAPDLVPLSEDYGVEGSQVDRSCYDALLRMIDDCNAASPRAYVISSYRTYEFQEDSYNNKVGYFMEQGYSEEDAKREAATIIAVPGTSEHHLGLAVDIIDTSLWGLEEEQENLPAQKWLMEHCWEYGFILRYPKDKIEITGIIYEPWHYRYVGEELAAELHESGLTLEEYMDSLG